MFSFSFKDAIRATGLFLGASLAVAFSAIMIAFIIAFIPIFIVAALCAYIFDIPITITRNKKQVGIYQRSTGYRKTYSQ